MMLTVFQALCPASLKHSLPQSERHSQAFNGEEVAVVGLHSAFENQDKQTPGRRGADQGAGADVSHRDRQAEREEDAADVRGLRAAGHADGAAVRPAGPPAPPLSRARWMTSAWVRRSWRSRSRRGRRRAKRRWRSSAGWRWRWPIPAVTSMATAAVAGMITGHDHGQIITTGISARSRSWPRA